jgi:hypothetical protein
VRKVLITKSSVIIDNQQEMINDCTVVRDKILKDTGKSSTTSAYSKYNVFAYTSPKAIWNELFVELRDTVVSYVGDENDLYFQCWMNFHSQSQLLKWHEHGWPYHGYICISPQDTSTVFKDYSVVNEIGNIYVGNGDIKHKVVSNSDFTQPRITLGFDITTCGDKMAGNIGLIPLFIKDRHA